MEAYYKKCAGEGTRQPVEHLFYFPDLKFGIIIHKTFFTGDSFFKFFYDMPPTLKSGYKKMEIKDDLAKLLQANSEIFNQTNSSINSLVSKLMEEK